MTDLTKAAQAVIESAAQWAPTSDESLATHNAIEALRAALAAQQAEPVLLQGGMSNDELRAAWDKKLHCEPKGQELSAFAVGIEVGFAHAQDLERQDWSRVHHVLKKHGVHPGRTDDHLADVIDQALAQQAAQPVAWHSVIAERQRQIESEGWTARHDDDHSDGSMALAAACYALNAATWAAKGTAELHQSYADLSPGARWPWKRKWWKPKSQRQDLVRAGALILAEIERFDRANPAHAAAQPQQAAAQPQQVTTCTDPHCPCQDGDTCHYKDAADGTKAWAAQPQQAADADDLYGRLHALSKVLESSGRIDEQEHRWAYATILDAMNAARAQAAAQPVAWCDDGALAGGVGSVASAATKQYWTRGDRVDRETAARLKHPLYAAAQPQQDADAGEQK